MPGNREPPSSRRVVDLPIGCDASGPNGGGEFLDSAEGIFTSSGIAELEG
jgi:hypothetical protein